MADRAAVRQGGPTFLFVPMSDLDALGSTRPMEPGGSQLKRSAGTGSAYLYTPATDADYQTRMFSPKEGIPEDPATGSASAILAAQLQAAGALDLGKNRLRLLQGVETGRPSRIGLTVIVTDGGIAELRVDGGAVAISSGQIVRPD